MFTATTTKKDFRSGILQITVSFSNGNETITEAFNVTSEDDLNNRIENRINALNKLAEFATALTLGAWTPPIKEAYTPDPIQEALNRVWEAKSKLEAKLIDETEYDAIVLEYKTIASEEVKK